MLSSFRGHREISGLVHGQGPAFRHPEALQDLVGQRILAAQVHHPLTEALIALLKALRKLLAVLVEHSEAHGDGRDHRLSVRQLQQSPLEALAAVELLLRQ